MEIERRVAPMVELRMEGEKGTICGYAARFGSWSKDLGGFVEVIHPGAFAEALKTSDTRALINHDPKLVIGRLSAGTLRLKEDDKGLWMEVDPPNTSYARDLQESIRRGDITEQSFGFRVKQDQWGQDEKGRSTRTILAFEKIFDVSPVTFPAYDETSVALRSLEAWKKNQEPKPEPPAVSTDQLRKRLALREKETL